MKTCRMCGSTKSVDAFERYRRICKPCRNHQQFLWRSGNERYLAKHRADNKAHYKRRGYQARMKRIHSIGSDEFERILSGQGGKCAICGSDQPGGQGRWHVDHSHVTGEIRGLLCHGCNTGIGLLKDNPEILDRAAAYLRRSIQKAKIGGEDELPTAID